MYNMYFGPDDECENLTLNEQVDLLDIYAEFELGLEEEITSNSESIEDEE